MESPLRDRKTRVWTCLCSRLMYMLIMCSPYDDYELEVKSLIFFKTIMVSFISQNI